MKTLDYSLRAPQDYIMHRGEMCLIDRIQHVEEKRIVTSKQVHSENIFFDHQNKGLPSWVGLELMAQTAGIWVGIDDERSGRPIQLGFLLGSRQFDAKTAFFNEGCELKIDVSADFSDGNIVVFNGSIVNNKEETLVEANLTAFRPDDVDTYLLGDN